MIYLYNLYVYISKLTIGPLNNKLVCFCLVWRFPYILLQHEGSGSSLGSQASAMGPVRLCKYLFIQWKNIFTINISLNFSYQVKWLRVIISVRLKMHSSYFLAHLGDLGQILIDSGVLHVCLYLWFKYLNICIVFF